MAQRHSSDDPTSSGVIIGVDPHTAGHTAAALGSRRQVLGHLRIPSDRAGYRQLRRWAARWPHRLWAVETTAGLGSALTQWLLSAGEQVVDVPAKLSARVRLLSRGHGRTTDQADAVSTALAACGTAARCDGSTPPWRASTSRSPRRSRTHRVDSRTCSASVASWRPRSSGGSVMRGVSRRLPASPLTVGLPR